jgi:hypothetical protein
MEKKSVWTTQLLKELTHRLQACTWDDRPLALAIEEDLEIEIAEGARAHTTGGTEVAGVAIDLDQDLTLVDVVTHHPVDVKGHTLHADIKPRRVLSY